MTRAARGQRGLVLAAVLFFILLMATAVATFLSRSTVDGLIARNRDRAAACEALARGGVRLAVALLLQDRLDELESGLPIETRDDVWARVGRKTLRVPDGGELALRIEDTGARLDLNALFQEGAPRHERTEIFLAELFAKVVDELPLPPEQKAYDPELLARNLIDWVDADDVRLGGGPEDAYYQEQVPPYRAANRPLLSLDELALVEAFDRTLVDALRPYADVHPLAEGDGINPNTAPSYVLALLFHGTTDDFRLAVEDAVRDVLDIRARGGILCKDETPHEDCTNIRDAVAGEIYPPPTFQTHVFRVSAEAAYGDVRRTVEAVVDRSDPAAPQILAWRVH